MQVSLSNFTVTKVSHNWRKHNDPLNYILDIYLLVFMHSSLQNVYKCESQFGPSHNAKEENKGATVLKFKVLLE